MKSNYQIENFPGSILGVESTNSLIVGLVFGLGMLSTIRNQIMKFWQKKNPQKSDPNIRIFAKFLIEYSNIWKSE